MISTRIELVASYTSIVAKCCSTACLSPAWEHQKEEPLLHVVFNC